MSKKFCEDTRNYKEICSCNKCKLFRKMQMTLGGK